MFANKRGLKREDFLFANGWFQQKVKKPEELHMQQFQISDCEQCNIFLFDSSACVYVDSCKYCNIFIGPSQSSIFVRDCEYVNIVSISQQFRVRSCINCKFAIFVQSQPIIQSSYGLKLSCFPQQLTYSALDSQIKQAKLNKWNNNWFDIYDFTPTEFSAQVASNYQLSSYEKEFIKIKELFFSKIKQQNIEQASQVTIPAVEGKTNIPTGQTIDLDAVIFVILRKEIQPSTIKSLILQAKYQLLPSQLKNILKNDQSLKNTKLLFLKIKKQHESRWKLSEDILKIVKNKAEKQIIENTLFAPFKDEH